MDEKTRYDEMVTQFKAYHKKHPKVWALFQKFALEAIGRGYKHYSATGIVELIRWKTDVPSADGRTTFKINNNYTSLYARWFMIKYPQYDGFFRLRELTSQDAPPTELPPLGPGDYPYTNQ